MARLCERPGCSAPASVTYGFEAARTVVWLAALATDGDRRELFGVLCRRHADALTPPRGWWLDDRRIAVPTLFHVAPDVGADDPAEAETPVPAAEPAAESDDVPEPPVNAKAPRRRRKVADDTEELPFDFELAARVSEPAATEEEPPARHPAADRPTAEPAHEAQAHHAASDADETRAMPWTPVFDRTDDLGGVLSARSPLLSRAFGLRRPPS